MDNLDKPEEKSLGMADLAIQGQRSSNSPKETAVNDFKISPEKYKGPIIRVAICCMEKKLSSRPMREILNFLSRNKDIEILRFKDEILFNKPIDQWIRCDVLIAFYSTGFPLQKAIKYVELYKPVMVNDLRVQHELWDRVKVLEKLRRISVSIAKSYVVYRG